MTALAEMIRRKDISSRQAIKAYYDWIDKVDGEINAVVQTPREDADARADEADAVPPVAYSGSTPMLP